MNENQTDTPAMPDFPQPVEQHAWLQRLVGEWDTEVQCFMTPDGPPATHHGRECYRMIGGFWLHGETTGKDMEPPFRSVLTLGFDPGKGKFIGTWVDSMTSALWVYEGGLDETGNVLTLETEGCCPFHPGRPTKFRDVLEIKDKDHKVYRGMMLGDDGKWNTGLVVTARRVK